MAENLENLILVTSIERPDYIGVKLIAQSEWDTVNKLMAEPNHYTTLFSMNRAVVLENYKVPKAYGLIRVSERSPYLWHLNLETKLRTSWLGKAPETIDGEVAQLTEMINKIRDESVRSKFPIKEVGQG